ncbi:hypothetical protein [Luteimonas sp. 100069]|uniref:hypothetical protein n=1 Tax=Luteimonas sp. 100069 TaxID=2006109 RepID=UPI000F4F87B7|nr:hypothetical protein [Luteimonas sp. 100069]
MLHVAVIVACDESVRLQSPMQDPGRIDVRIATGRLRKSHRRAMQQTQILASGGGRCNLVRNQLFDVRNRRIAVDSIGRGVLPVAIRRHHRIRGWRKAAIGARCAQAHRLVGSEAGERISVLQQQALDCQRFLAGQLGKQDIHRQGMQPARSESERVEKQRTCVRWHPVQRRCVVREPLLKCRGSREGRCRIRSGSTCGRGQKQGEAEDERCSVHGDPSRGQSRD